MQIKRALARIVIAVPLLWALAAATSLDGTNAIAYQTNNYVFRDGDLAQGFVRFNNGFTVLPGATMKMDTVVSASGGFDLRDSGVMTMQGNLVLDSMVTLTTSGYIRGKTSTAGDGNTIFLGGDLTLAAASHVNVLHITGDASDTALSGDLVIDGRGNTLTIGNYAQIFVDTNVTLTLRNMTIRTGTASLNNPSIQLAAPGSKLALDNVVFELGADFHFSQGQLFIHNEVAVTGTSAFVYQSPVPSFITSGATWSFDAGTTFSVAPATYTDIPYTAGTATSNNFLLFADSTAALSLSGCSFKTTYTGLRLTKGVVQFENKVAIETGAGNVFDTTTPLTSLGTTNVTYYPFQVSWTADGRYLAVAVTDQTSVSSSGSGGAKIVIYKFNGSTLSLVLTLNTGYFGGTNTTLRGVAWSPDGKYLAAADCYYSNLYVFRFNGTSAVLCGGAVGTVTNPVFVAWSPDGKYISVATVGANYLSTYSFNGYSTPTYFGATGLTGNYPGSVHFSPDGKYIAATTNASGYAINICSFDGASAPSRILSPALASAGRTEAWSPDGRYVAVGCNNGLQMFRFTGTSLVQLGTASTGTVYCVKWSPDGRYLIVGAYNGGSIIYVLKFDGASTPVIIGSGGISNWPQGMDWSSDGNYIAMTQTPVSNPGYVWVYRCNYDYSTQPPQGLSNGLAFGNSAKGSSYNLNVQVNGGARIELNGKIKDDSA